MRSGHQSVFIIISIVVILLSITFAVGSSISFIFVNGNSTPRTATPSAAENGAEPTSKADIKVHPQIMSHNQNEAVSTSTEVRIHVYGYDDLQYEDVTLCLYDRNGTVLYSELLGTITSPDTDEFYRQYTVNATVEMRPKYVVVDHPELRNDPRFAAELRVWDPEREAYDFRLDGLGVIQNNFEYPRTNEPGQCG